jgi:phosphatidylserine/phosphatidylglycerophosphate/cardiolipin synthase-like enzyme
MWNTSVKIEYIAGLIADALENYSVNGVNAQFNQVIMELRSHFTNCSEEEITDIISLCMRMYSSKKIEHIDLVLTVPDSFRVKTLRTRDVMCDLIENTEKGLTITGYSISDYFVEMLDIIIKKSQQGVYVRLYVNDIEKQKDALDRLLAYRSRFLQVYEYQQQEDDKMAALHAKLVVSDVRKSLVSSANLSYHGMQGNVEMGFLIESHNKAKQIEDVMKELVRMKVFCQSRE